jgi:hypothetical protein
MCCSASACADETVLGATMGLNSKCTRLLLHFNATGGNVLRQQRAVILYCYIWSLHEQCHQLSGWGVVSLLYLLACALQYRYLDNIWFVPQA